MLNLLFWKCFWVFKFLGVGVYVWVLLGLIVRLVLVYFIFENISSINISK